MTEIKQKNQIKDGMFLLWDNTDTYREKFFGPFTVCKVHKIYTAQEFYLKFPDNDVPQSLDFEIIQKMSKIITEEEDPEYFI